MIQPISEIPDAGLIQQFVEHNDQQAFETLIKRYSSLVMGVCRRRLQNDHDAEDAFQTTFTTLAKKAPTLKPPFALCSWLYTTALRAAGDLQKKAHYHKEEKMSSDQLSEMSSTDSAQTSVFWNELSLILDQEVQALPEKYRIPLLLCYFKGKTNEEAARELSFPLGSISNRLKEAREILRKRLVTKGFAFSTAVLFAAIEQHARADTVSNALIDSTAHKGCLVLSQQSHEALSLSDKVVQIFQLTGIKTILATVLIGAAGWAGSSFLLNSSAKQAPDQKDLILAISKHDIPALTAYLKAGASPNTKPVLSMPLLSIAVAKGDLQVVQLLLKNGADPDLQDDFGRSALFRAVHSGNESITKALLEAHANPNLQDNDGLTPMHYKFVVDPRLDDSADQSPKTIVSLLLQYKADPNIQTKDDRSVLALVRAASIPSKSDVIQILQNAGAQD